MGQWRAARRIMAGLLIAAAGAAATIAPERAAAQTLGDTLARAYANSGLLEQNRALLRAADEDVAQAVAALRPVISWSTQVTRQFGERRSAQTFNQVQSFASTDLSVGVDLEWLLYDFGRSQLQVDAAKETVLATRERLVAIEQQVLLRAVRAFMAVRRESENVALRENNVRLITRELRAAEDRFEVGEVTRTDVSLAEARLAGARANLALAQGNLAQAQEEFRAAVGTRPGALAEPGPVPQTVSSVEQARRMAMRNHPEMREAQRQVTAAELRVAVARAAMKPSVTLGGRLSVNEDLENRDYTHSGQVSLGVGGPIYRGGQLSALLRQAQANRDAARANLLVVSDRLAQQAGDAWAQLQVARAAREASLRQIRAAEVAFEGVREEARLGARTTLDVLNAEQELLDARATLISASADEYIAAYSLLSAIGLMTADHLDLSVPRYDPSEYYNLVKSAPAVNSAQGRALDRVLESIGQD
ncbi:TolC family outer membrane protein [Rhodosalinus halophilus]|nr:TolC family outer membrane protein [Rhodosalinus halophilus]